MCLLLREAFDLHYATVGEGGGGEPTTALLRILAVSLSLSSHTADLKALRLDSSLLRSSDTCTHLTMDRGGVRNAQLHLDNMLAKNVHAST